MSEPDRIVLALVKRLAEIGALDMDDINAIADALEGDDADGAHQVRCAGIEAMVGPTSEADHAAVVRRKSIRLVETDGGKSEG